MSDPLNWTKVTRVTIDHQGDLGDEVDQSDQGDKDYQGVLGCTVRCCAKRYYILAHLFGRGESVRSMVSDKAGPSWG